MRKDWRREYFSIPNLLSYLRIVLLPVFLYAYLHADSRREYVNAFLILAISFASDLLDGQIARRFHMVTEFGKMLDPLADKLTQGFLALALVMRYPLMRLFVALFILKEAYMVCMGLYLRKTVGAWKGAQMYGKINTCIVDAGVMVLLLFPGLPEMAGNGIILVMLVSLFYTTLRYVLFHRAILTEAKTKDKRN